jgi:non-homologous end joining protein Ku
MEDLEGEEEESGGSAEVIDLMEILRKSLGAKAAAASAPKTSAAKKTASKAPAMRTPAKKVAAKKKPHAPRHA